LNVGGIGVDIPILRISGVDSQTALDSKYYNLQAGVLSSALEHVVPEQLFDTDPNHPPDAISAVKALAKAATQGQRIYQINTENYATVLPNIHHDQATMLDISAALTAGKEVITHTDAVSVSGWSGAGYIIVDPQTGDGAFKIGGGSNGGLLGGFVAFTGIALLAVSAPLTGPWLLVMGLSAMFAATFATLAYLEIQNQGGVSYEDVCLPILRLAEMTTFLAFLPPARNISAILTGIMEALAATLLNQVFDPAICTEVI
jgi:hypothetical protein